MRNNGFFPSFFLDIHFLSWFAPEKELMEEVLLGNDGGDVFGIGIMSLLLLVDMVVFGDDITEELLKADKDEGETEDLCFCS